jgi:hypothetical protein
MTNGWIAALLIAFGISVAVFGVIAYLRMIKSSSQRNSADINRAEPQEASPVVSQPATAPGNEQMKE